jgi:hypothetical protein
VTDRSSDALPPTVGHRPRVLLVTGFGRSGTTLINTVLGSTPGVFAAGETRFLWERALVEGRRCGCGEIVQDCPVWGLVLEKAFGGADQIDPRALMAEDAQVMRTRQLPKLLASRFVGDRLVRGLHVLPDALTAVYQAAQEITGAQLIVDTSKPPSFGYVLSHLDGIDLWILHVVRDPRAVAYSWTRTKQLTDGGARKEMLRLSPHQSALQWDLWNGAAGWLWGRSDRYLRLRYEDFVADPRGTIDRISDFVDLELAPPFTGPSEVATTPVHTVAGNADRMRTGPLRIAMDDAWRADLAARARWTVTALTAPLAHRYGYPSSPARPAPRI